MLCLCVCFCVIAAMALSPSAPVSVSAANWLLTATNQKQKAASMAARIRGIEAAKKSYTLDDIYAARIEARQAGHESSLKQGRWLGYKDGYAEALGDVTTGGVFTKSLVRGWATIGQDLRIRPPSDPIKKHRCPQIA